MKYALYNMILRDKDDGGSSDNVAELRNNKGGGNNVPKSTDVINSARASIIKAAKESFEAKVKEKLKLREQHTIAVKTSTEALLLLDKEIEKMGEEFDAQVKTLSL